VDRIAGDRDAVADRRAGERSRDAAAAGIGGEIAHLAPALGGHERHELRERERGILVDEHARLRELQIELAIRDAPALGLGDALLASGIDPRVDHASDGEPRDDRDDHEGR